MTMKIILSYVHYNNNVNISNANLYFMNVVNNDCIPVCVNISC